MDRIVRDAAFATRLADAIHSNPSAPDGHGRQKWLREEIFSRTGRKVTPEGVRKWFSGEARPRPSMMAAVAAAVDCELKWLSLGILPAYVETDPARLCPAATAHTNIVIGILQMMGHDAGFERRKHVGPVENFLINDAGRYRRVHVRTVDPKSKTELRIPIQHGWEDDLLIIPRLQDARRSNGIELFVVPPDRFHSHRAGDEFVLTIHPGDALELDRRPLPGVEWFNRPQDA